MFIFPFENTLPVISAAPLAVTPPPRVVIALLKTAVTVPPPPSPSNTNSIKELILTKSSPVSASLVSAIIKYLLVSINSQRTFTITSLTLLLNGISKIGLSAVGRESGLFII
jgi:hypothetical protein